MNAWRIAISNITAVPRPPLEPEKTCGRCKEIKPVSQFYLMGGRISRSCKACHKSNVYSTRKK